MLKQWNLLGLSLYLALPACTVPGSVGNPDSFLATPERDEAQIIDRGVAQNAIAAPYTPYPTVRPDEARRRCMRTLRSCLSVAQYSGPFGPYGPSVRRRNCSTQYLECLQRYGYFRR